MSFQLTPDGLVGDIIYNNGAAKYQKPITGGAISALLLASKWLGDISNNTSKHITDLLGGTQGYYLVSVNGSADGGSRDTGIYLVVLASANDIYDSGSLVTEQLGNKGLRQTAATSDGHTSRWVTVTTITRGYDACYGNCGSFDMDQYGTISVGGAYGGCSVYATHLIGDSRVGSGW